MIIVYIEFSTGVFVLSSELGPPALSVASECVSPLPPSPTWVLGGATLACGWRGWGDQIPTKGQTLCYGTLCILGYA
jgi:hypothetical protein